MGSSEQRRKKVKTILIIALILSLLSNVKDAKQGFMDGWNAGRAMQVK